MREILFRGKRLDNGEWAEGDLSYLVHDKQVCYIFPPDGYDSPDRYEVDPETVGQYIGIEDGQGQRIFEGDVIIHYNKPGDSSAHVVGVVFWDDESCSFKKRNIFNGRAYDLSTRCEYEVIGNIYDNPELMEERHEEGDSGL